MDSTSCSTQQIDAISRLAAGSFFMRMLDATILRSLLPSLAVDLATSPFHMQSMGKAYLLAVAVFIPVSGRLAKRFGIRWPFFSSIVVFSLGSLLCAFAESLPFLVVARAVQGMLSPVLNCI